MKYTRDTIVGDLTMYETFEGTPEEIIELINCLEEPKSVEQTINIDSVNVASDSLKEINKKAREVALGI